MQFKDYYQTLGVEATASAAEIKTAYRRLARKYHPDVSKEKEAEERFKAVNEAYEVLKDAQKRQEYDRLKASGYRPGEEFRPPPGFGGGPYSDFGSAGGGFSDFFESLFGQARRAQESAPQGSRVKLAIPLERVYSGGKQKIRVANKTLEVSIPAGIKPGQSIRLAGMGERGSDLMIEIAYQEHPEFELDGLNVLYTLTLMPWQAALGDSVSVPTLGGHVTLKIPAGSDAGKRLRLKARGLPGKPVAGDQIVEIEISAPAPRTEQQAELYRKMAQVFASN